MKNYKLTRGGDFSKKSNKIFIGIILILVVLVIGISYAWLTDTILGKKEYIIKAGNLNLVLDETSQGLTIENSIPISDEEGLNLAPATFSVINNSKNDVCYEIYIDDSPLEEKEIRVDDKFIKYSLDKGKEIGTANVLTQTGTSPNRLLDRGNLRGKGRMDYKLRLWFNIEEDGYFENQIFKGRLRIEATQCKFEEEITPPELAVSTADWSKAPVEVTIKTSGSATSGLSHYEYYISNDINAIPTIEQTPTGTTDNKITISDRGYYFVYYRSISMIGSKSNWSTPAIVKYDDQEIILTHQDIYEEDTSKILRILFKNTDIKINDIIEYTFTIPKTPVTIDFNDQILCNDFNNICSITTTENKEEITYMGDIKVIQGTNYIKPSDESYGYRFFDFTYETTADRKQLVTYQVIVHRF